MKSSAESYGVIGLGRFGTALVKTLATAGKEVIAVDKDEAKVKAVRGYTDYAFVIDELNETSLKETGMQNCGTVTICIGEQIDISILTTMLVTKLGVPHVTGCSILIQCSCLGTHLCFQCVDLFTVCTHLIIQLLRTVLIHRRSNKKPDQSSTKNHSDQYIGKCKLLCHVPDLRTFWLNDRLISKTIFYCCTFWFPETSLCILPVSATLFCDFS